MCDSLVEAEEFVVLIFLSRPRSVGENAPDGIRFDAGFVRFRKNGSWRGSAGRFQDRAAVLRGREIAASRAKKRDARAIFMQ